MKRFSPREFALLCLPVAVVACAGFWASRRSVSQPYVAPKFLLSYEPPSTLNAFEGAKTVIVAKLRDDSQGNSYVLDGMTSKIWLDVATSQGVKTWRADGTGTLPLKGASMHIASNQWYYLHLKEVPVGDLNFGISGKAISSSFPSKAEPHQIKQNLRVDKTKLQNFDFSLPRAPNLKIKSATIGKVRANALDVEIAFVFLGSKAMTDITWQENYKTNGLFFVSTWTSKPDIARTHTAEATLTSTDVTASTSVPGANPPLLPASLTGRVSADNCWPLAFEIEPFDFNTAKVSQQLKFKSWPAPLPSGAKN